MSGRHAVRRIITCSITCSILMAPAAAPSSSARADTIRDREWITTSLHLAAAHRYSTGGGVVIAEIDSGVDRTHPDLVGNVLVGTSIFPGADGENGDTDTYGHGTAIASLLVGHGHGLRNRDGVLGIAPGAKVLPVRNGVRIGTNIPQAIDWSIDHHVQVICIAEGSPIPNPDLVASIHRAEAADIVVVAAAGDTTDGPAIDFPAGYPGVVAVAGTDQHGDHAAISPTGPQIELAAPATNLVQDYLQHQYAEGTGTSASAAIVAGAAALVRARFPKLSAVEVIHRLTATAIDKGPPGRDPEYGYGLVNIVGALTADVPPLPQSTSPTPPPSPTISVSAAASHSVVAPTKSISISMIALVAAAVALLAVVGAWIAARRKR